MTSFAAALIFRQRPTLGQIVGQPRQGMVRVAHYVRSYASSHLDPVDQSRSDYLREIGRGNAIYRIAQNAPGSEEVIGDQGGCIRLPPIGVTVVHKLDGRYVRPDSL